MTKKKTFENKLNEIEEIIKTLEDDKLDLKDSLDKYKKGIEIIKECQDDLSKVRKELKIISGE